MHDDETPSRFSTPPPVTLFFDKTEEERKLLLSKASYKLAHPEVLEKKLKLISFQEEIQKPRVRFLPTASDDMLKDCPGSGVLDDGWFRVVLMLKLGGIAIYKGERFEKAWLAPHSKAIAGLLGKHRWPSKKASLRMRSPHFLEGHVLKIEFDSEEKQYFFVIEDGPGISRTYWFPPEFKASGIGKDWIQPRKLSLSSPWKSR